VSGDFEVDHITTLIHKHFADLPRRKAPPVPNCSEPLPKTERRGVKYDAMAPMPALAAGYRVPDPIKQLPDFLAAVVLAEVLAEGEASRLYQRLVKNDRSTLQVYAMVGTFGDPFDVRDPTMLQLIAYHPGADADTVMAAIDEEVERVASDLAGPELDRVLTSLVSGHLRHLDHLLQRTMLITTLEQQRNRAELANELPELLGDITVDDVRAAATKWLRPDQRALLEVRPGTPEAGA
jgi:predicted Zn-dependent peptidase